MSFIHEDSVYNTKSAKIVVPKIIDLFKPKSVLDVGCGLGTWLKVFIENGIEDCLGVDGDYIDKKQLRENISEEVFYSHDLEADLKLNRMFDIVLSLEVIEHISPRNEDVFIESLIKHSNTIIFSGAIPNQGGQDHINEQWLTYWIDKFQRYNFFAHDIIRPLIWDNQNIDIWYKQNIIVFKNNIKGNLKINNCIHPEMFLYRTNELVEELQYLKSGGLGVIYYIKIVMKLLKKKLIFNKR